MKISDFSLIFSGFYRGNLRVKGVPLGMNLVEKFEKMKIRNSRNSRVHVYRWGYVCAVLEGWDMGCAVLGSWSHSPTRCLGEK